MVRLATGMDQLTIPRKLYPATAAGQAILALTGPGTDVGEMVIEYDIGIRVAQGDSEGMAKELVSLLNDPERVLSLNSHSRMVFEQNCTREISIGLYLEILDKAVKY